MIKRDYNSPKAICVVKGRYVFMAEKFNERIAELLKEKEMTHYIKGDRVPRAAVMVQIANALETSPDYLMYGKPNNSEAEIDQAVRLIARNSEQLSHEDKMRIMNILLGDK